MLDSNTAPLVEPTRHTSPRRGVRSGSDGYPRATVLLQSNQGRQSYQLYDDFNYEEPSPERQTRFGRPQSSERNSMNNNIGGGGSGDRDVESFPYYQPGSANNTLTKSPWGGSLWNPETQGNSVLCSFFILMNSTLGAGLTTQPYAARRTGWILFILLQVIMAWTTDWTHGLMVDLAEATGVTSYEDLVDGLYGTMGTFFMSLIVMIQNVGSMLLYFMLFTQSAPDVARWMFQGQASTSSLYDSSQMTTRAMYVSIAVVFFVLPFSFFRRIGRLSVTSGIVACSAVYITCAVVNAYYTRSTCPHQPPLEEFFNDTLQLSSTLSSSLSSSSSFSLSSFSSSFSSSSSSSSSALSSSTISPSSSSSSSCEFDLPSVAFSSSSFLALPMLMYSYMSHTTVLPIHHEISGVKRSGVRRSNAILSVRLMLMLVFVMFTLVGMFGGMTYGFQEIETNIMASYAKDMHATSNNLSLNVMLLCWVVSLGWSIPSIMYPTKRTIMLSFIPILRGRKVGTAGPPASWMTNALISLCLSLLCGGLSLLVPFTSFQHVVVVLGATTSTLLVVVCPAMFYLKLHGLCARDAHGRVASFGIGRFVACFLLFLGVVCGPVCLIGSIIYWSSF